LNKIHYFFENYNVIGYNKNVFEYEKTLKTNI